MVKAIPTGRCAPYHLLREFYTSSEDDDFSEPSAQSSARSLADSSSRRMQGIEQEKRQRKIRAAESALNIPLHIADAATAKNAADQLKHDIENTLEIWESTETVGTEADSPD